MRPLLCSALVVAACGGDPSGGAPDLSTGAAPDLASPSGDAAMGPPGTRTFGFTNRCAYPVWVGSIGNPSPPARSCNGNGDCPPLQECNPGNRLCTWSAPNRGGWQLDAGQATSAALPPSWGGRFWPRTGCAGFNAQGVPACQTGDCGGHLECPSGIGGTPPATLAEFTLIPPPGVDFYDVSIVDGHNVPLEIRPRAGSFDPGPPPGANLPYYCGRPGCAQAPCGMLAACPWDLDATTCPSELHHRKGGQYVGCLSANQACAFDPGNAPLDCAGKRDLYGCVPGGPNDVQGSCYSSNAAPRCCGCPGWSPAGECRSHNPSWELPSLPERYAKVLKDACPTAYSFPYDDPTSTFTCRGTAGENVGYEIIFCP